MTDELKNLEEKAQEYDASQIQVLEGLTYHHSAEWQHLSYSGGSSQSEHPAYRNQRYGRCV